MKLFALFLLTCFWLGIFMRRQSTLQRTWILLLLALFLSFAYIYLDQI
jgi:hypothetical protein